MLSGNEIHDSISEEGILAAADYLDRFRRKEFTRDNLQSDNYVTNAFPGLLCK